jgi:hypothetical protein
VILLTPAGIKTDVHESSVKRKLAAGWKTPQAEDSQATPKPKSKLTKGE